MYRECLIRANGSLFSVNWLSSISKSPSESLQIFVDFSIPELAKGKWYLLPSHVNPHEETKSDVLLAEQIESEDEGSSDQLTFDRKLHQNDEEFRGSGFRLLAMKSGGRLCLMWHSINFLFCEKAERKAWDFEGCMQGRQYWIGTRCSNKGLLQ